MQNLAPRCLSLVPQNVSLKKKKKGEGNNQVCSGPDSRLFLHADETGEKPPRNIS